MEVEQQTLPKSKCIVKVSWAVHGHQDTQFTLSGFRSQLCLNFCGPHLLLRVLNDVSKILTLSVKKSYIIKLFIIQVVSPTFISFVTLNLYLSVYLQAGRMPLMSPFQFAEKFIIYCDSIVCFGLFLHIDILTSLQVFFTYFHLAVITFFPYLIHFALVFKAYSNYKGHLEF